MSRRFWLSVLFCLPLLLTARDIPTLTGRVVDTARLLQGNEAQLLSEQLRTMESQGLAQMAILTVPDLGDETIETFSIRVAEAWKLGHKDRDNGLLLVISLSPRKIRLEVGYGLEAVITDQISDHLIRKHLVPAFRQNAYGQGIMAFQQALYGVLSGELPVKPEELKKEKKGGIPFLFIIMVALVLIFSRRGSGPGPFIMMGGGGGGGSWGGFSGGGGGFSGGGGSFGGGGSSGSW